MAAFWPTTVATDANLYVAKNSLQTTLATALGTGDTSVVLASSTGFPVAGGVTIDNEVIFYTNISGATLTGCTRGADGTTAASHSVGVPVGASIIAFHHNGLMAEIEAIETFLDTHLGKSTTVTATEYGYLLGVTSAIQTQLNAKATDSLVVHLAGVETISGIKTFSADINLNATKKFYLDGGSDTYIYEAGANNPVIVCGGSAAIDISTTQVSIEAGRQFIIPSGKKFLLDGSGSGDTYLIESASNVVSFFAGGNEQFKVQNGNLTVVDTGAGMEWVRSSYDTFAWEQAGTGFKLRNTTDGRDEIQLDQAGGVAIRGANSNGAATAGFVGEVISSTISSFTNFPTSGNYGDLTSISLTAGDWFINAQLLQIKNGATLTTATLGVSTTSGNSGTGLTDGDTQISFVPNNTSTGAGSGHVFVHVNLSATTTYYLKYTSSYTVATPQATGKITAVRIR